MAPVRGLLNTVLAPRPTDSSDSVRPASRNSHCAGASAVGSSRGAPPLALRGGSASMHKSRLRLTLLGFHRVKCRAFWCFLLIFNYGVDPLSGCFLRNAIRGISCSAYIFHLLPCARMVGYMPCPLPAILRIAFAPAYCRDREEWINSMDRSIHSSLLSLFLGSCFDR